MSDLADQLVSGDRAALARAITLVESTKVDHQAEARALLTAAMDRTGKAWRVGLTGVPGVGKSTLIEKLGTRLTGEGHRVAVLAVDPSSTRTKGSILGDKTRMGALATDRNAFIRPSPAAGTLGGVAGKTRESMLLCEAAGYDVVIVETVGVGQSETVVADMVDVFVAMMLPGAGDELQGIKKGLIELADILFVNKAEGENATRARRSAKDLEAALHLLAPASPHWSPVVLTGSALSGDGIAALWEAIETHRAALKRAGALDEKRRAQQVRWFHAMVEERVVAAFRADSAVKAALPGLEDAVAQGRLPASEAAERLLGEWR
ncbi:methylmalonyl Co-A mutase-associated GTPase MeaB [Marinicauda salina]|uniref:Methylmalonyl Co-A mutase-associated GTPase MeaB n=1 Tax=Marinicauda salina TaxID=2135793 RepID=A0A2U2BTU4_9PROT|nr:methylmalonyl Co-A mutase-associated GTPase MeaB [Marinicauda salina]PWE17436.1 methylmalonyl Co-A mutase-associated GTPase MeaB [Marinicauda salina]